MGRVLTVIEPCYVAWINSNAKCNNLPESKGWRGYRWIITERGRSLILRNGNPKQPDISIAKFGKEIREVGGVHSTNNYRDNKTLYRKGTLL
jgi:hypothetical protein